jgi:nicotinamide-nucleotide amidase
MPNLSMQAVIIAVGDELTDGATVDTNSGYLSARLVECGIATRRHVTVGDDAAAIAEAIGGAAGQARLVIVTGGLGPTADDLTRQGLAAAMGAALVEDPRQAERIAAFFAARGRPMKPSNRAQALLPAGAQAIDNDCGTAPGIAARLGEAEVFVLPGPPQEMREMFETKVLPRLPAAGAIAKRIVHTFGVGESDVGEAIADLMGRGRNPTVGTTVSAGVISVRITAAGPTKQAAEAAADETAAEVRRRLGELVFAGDDQTMPQVVGEALQAAGETLAAAESCTGGMLGEMITEVPGASGYFLGGVVAYADRAKTELLGVPAGLIAAHGAVSGPVAEALAEGARRRFGADWGLGVTGIAGPAGGSAEKPVGLVYIAVAGRGGAAVHRHVFPGDREVIRRRAALAALNHLRLALVAAGEPGAEG